MATKSFLSIEQTQWALQTFQAPTRAVHKTSTPTLGSNFSHWLAQKLTERMQIFAAWEDSCPILLGSWARDELCPKSDIDILFVGPEHRVRELVTEANEEGLKLRYRVPENMKDWTVGVAEFDILALLKARALTLKGKDLLFEQQQMINTRETQFRKRLLKAVLNERRARNIRYDSIANYLEPNIKYGAGGLRDIEQALAIESLFKLDGHAHASQVLSECKDFLLAVRQRLHLLGGVDILSAAEQHEVAKFFGFEKPQQFMSQLQLNLSRASFYSDVLVHQAKVAKKTVHKIQSIKVQSLLQAMALLRKQPDLLTQHVVRSQVSELFSHHVKTKDVAEALESNFNIKEEEDFFVALFQSRILEKCIPSLGQIKGLVQHDHYHRFTVDAHLLQSIRELKRVYKNPKRLGRLSTYVKALSVKDWEILLWAALYHDIAKGRQGDHSSDGAEQVRKDLGQTWKFDSKLVEEVAWLVESHLILSTAAFRRNPQAPSTWKFLIQRGAMGVRLERLALLTAIDIRATNPEAWNTWKERLLFDLVTAANSPEAQHLMKWMHLADRTRTKISDSFTNELEPVLLSALSPQVLLKEYKLLSRTQKNLPALWLRNKKGELWVRFHNREDRPGLFLHYVQLLFALGCTIQQSSIKTLTTFGVYDWFHVRSRKSLAQLKKQSESLSDQVKVSVPKVQFNQIEIVASDEVETVLSFRGKDQRGLLLAAAQALFEEGLTIRWAKVHTWGRQIDDIFAVNAPSAPQEILHKLTAKLT